jgi:hypothetical protein
MVITTVDPGPLGLADAAARLADLGFLASPDLPDRPGPAFLLVALRDRATLRHYDPETVEYWVTREGRGTRQVLTRETRLPVEWDFSWGMIRLSDRLRVTNEYLTFGGWLSAAAVGDATIAVFRSPAPLLRRGGHSQGWDEGADSLGAFFGRLLVAVDYTPGFEGRLALAAPLERYAAFVRDEVCRYRKSAALRIERPRMSELLQAEARRLIAHEPEAWSAGEALLASANRHHSAT